MRVAVVPMIEAAAALILIVGPLLFGAAGLIAAHRAPRAVLDSAGAWNWRLTICSALFYVLAFNLTFFVQELFLVLPKALTPGLRPTLFHNNHHWEGEHPLAGLFQGTGALAILASGVVCALLLRRGRGRSGTARLFLIWMAYNGFFQALPQVVIGSVNPRNDVGMAMDYLRLGATARTAAALTALATMPLVAVWLARALLSLAEDPVETADGRARSHFVFRVATLPALLAMPLIIPFRIPREFVEVVLLPVVVTGIGIAWMQAGAWSISATTPRGHSGAISVAYPLGAVLGLLFAFQVLLRPGIHFYR